MLKLLRSDLHFLLQSDVNTVCFADETGHIIYSGSDDGFCKVNIMFAFPGILGNVIEVSATCFLPICFLGGFLF